MSTVFNFKAAHNVGLPLCFILSLWSKAKKRVYEVYTNALKTPKYVCIQRESSKVK